MPRFAFSTVACPELLLPAVADMAEDLQYDAIDLYTEGPRSTSFACDPAMTDDAKAVRVFRTVGVEPGVLSTSIRFDEPVFPPIIGRAVTDMEGCVRRTYDAVLLAQKLGAPLVRVLGYEAPSRTSLGSTTKLIRARLEVAATAARGTGVRVVLENGGSYATGVELARLLDRLESPHVGAAYSVAAAHHAGERPEDGIAALADRLALVRVTDFNGGTPVAFGEGDVPNHDALRTLARDHWDGLVTFDYPRAWFDSLADLDTAREVLGASIERMHHAYHGSPAATH
ncbi:MAG: TIM barrel protein [Planctomycetota bacterium]